MTSARTTKAAQPIPASIPMPDSEVRLKWWYQIYVRLSRPTLDWVGVGSAVWATFLCDYVDKPMDDGTRIIVLGFVCALHGVRSFEKVKGVA